LHIYALPSARTAVETLLDLWDLRSRPVRHFPIHIHTIEGRENELMLKNENFTITTAPMLHSVPSVATRIVFPNGTNFVYSSDTGPCQQLVDFARGTDYVLMECTFCNEDDGLAELTQHMNSGQYRNMAEEINARHTLLIHHSDVSACPHNEILQEIGLNENPNPRRVYIPSEMEIIDLE
jgi:ribonuclease BN (tRNA processing enzyme)